MDALCGVPAAVMVAACGGAAVVATSEGTSIEAGDVVVACDGVELSGLQGNILELATRGRVGAQKDMTVLRRGSSVSIKETLREVSSLREWRQGERNASKLQSDILEAQMEVEVALEDAFAAAYGSSRHRRRGSPNQLTFPMSTLSSKARHLLDAFRIEVLGELEDRLKAEGIEATIRIAGGHWSVVLPLPQTLAPHKLHAAHKWAERSVRPIVPEDAVGCMMDLTEAINYLMASAAVKGGLSDYACQSAEGRSFTVVLRATGPQDGGSAGRRFVFHMLFALLNQRLDCDSGKTLFRDNGPLVFGNWAKIWLHEKHAAPRVRELWVSQIVQALETEFVLRVPGTNVVHSVRVILGDVSMGDTPMLSFFTGTYSLPSHEYRSAYNGDPCSHFSQRNTICEHFISIGDRERLYHGSQRWIQQQMARLPARMKSVDRNEQIARITRLAALNHTPSTVRPDLPPPSSQSRLREYLL